MLNSLSYPSIRYVRCTRDDEDRLSVGWYVRCREDATPAEELFTVLAVLNSWSYRRVGSYFGGRGDGVQNPVTGVGRKVRDTRVVVKESQLREALGYEPPFGDLIESGHLTVPDPSNYQWFANLPGGRGNPGQALPYPEGAHIPNNGYTHITSQGMSIYRLELGDRTVPTSDPDGEAVGVLFEDLSS
ncbi:hypothetical protein AD006_12365 [Pseudonocardia sp. EC080610-09]|uniref:hypothetical protein n=1 Tax=unclassified Pseudonocardia TaxID=2619320 RepID=UPI0006CB31A0|nr:MULTISPECIES: hypothetical protein [unclassified Pseudonocardia]ALE72586.1 hypothetical protein FRP1_04720 [Pseudonocardia sp. EC080625-04]ALL75900.1 hypothetical protein AD006_12365 [Pseudonocardia sp. EC080610-09]ALL82927.1 hypothetical protein AD017_20195 [Pseudonocardia sp. EC080619-01]